MTICKRFWIGVYLAASSFWLLWLHKKLLAYLSFAALTFFCIQVFLYNLPLIGFAGDEFSLLIVLQGMQYQITISRWFYQVAFVIASFVYFFMLTVLHLGLINHTLAIVHGNVSIGIRKALAAVLKHWRMILKWSLLFVALYIGMHVIMISAAYFNHPLAFVEIGMLYILMLGWSLLTFFVLPIIIAENRGVCQAIRRSFQLISAVFFEIIGAQCWVFIICILAIVPMVMFFRAMGSQAGLSFLFVLMSWLIVAASYIVLSAQTVIKALLYQRAMLLTEQ